MGNVYPAEFKAQVVELHRRQGRSLAELGREFHLSATTVANWVRAANAADYKDPTLTSEDKAELVLLRRQLKAREEELEIERLEGEEAAGVGRHRRLVKV